MPAAEPPLLWLRFENEASSCPACGSVRIVVMDVFPIPRKTDGRRVAFLTGCRACGLLFANPLPTQEQLDQYYSDEGPWAEVRGERMRRLEALYRRWAEKPARTADRRLRPKIRRVPGGPELLLEALAPYLPVEAPAVGAKALDFGCGDGKFLNRLQDRGWDTYGIEPSTQVPFFRHHRLEAPPQDASFDFAVLHHVLEHVTAPREILRTIAESLREGGVLFISVPRIDTLSLHGDFSYCIDGRRHLLAFSERCLITLLASAGFATTARLDLPELDALRTKGKPSRLRIVATRTATPPPPPDRPLVPAVEALRQYARASGGVAGHVRRMLPVRLRAALLDRARERRTRERARRKLSEKTARNA